jgi:hypothetical protein
MNPWFPTNLVSLQKKKIMLPIAGDILIEKAAPKFEYRLSDSQEWVACYLQNRKKINYRELNYQFLILIYFLKIDADFYS